MELKSRKFLLYLSLLWLTLIVLLGLWWLFLIVKISGELDRDMLRMATWEGATFLLLLLCLSLTLFYFYLQDLKKNQSMGSFFASLTHELKTPLASMKLQAEVIRETLQADASQTARLQTLTTRLIEDAGRLEDELDKLLQLSRMERGGELYLEKVPLTEFFDPFKRKLGNKVTLDIVGDIKGEIWGDEFALNLVLRNLVDNSLKHAKSRHIHIKIQEHAKTIQMDYDDHGEAYLGNLQHLGKLFYKAPNSRGQGIGLYLSKMLMNKMEGKLEISKSPHLLFHLTLKKYEPTIHSHRGR